MTSHYRDDSGPTMVERVQTERNKLVARGAPLAGGYYAVLVSQQQARELRNELKGDVVLTVLSDEGRKLVGGSTLVTVLWGNVLVLTLED